MNATITKMVIGILLGVAWVGLAALGKTDVAPLVAFIQYALTGLAAHALTMINPGGKDAPPAPPASTQAGHAMPAMMITLALGSLLLMAGCSGLSVQWVASYSTTDLATALKMPVAVAVPAAAVVPAIVPAK